MADDVQDVYIATEAGDAGWQSLTELTASKVDAKLPIESEDGEVVLSDSSGSFIVSTDEKNRFEAAGGFASLVSLGNSVTIQAHTGTNILVGAGGYIQMSDQVRVGYQDASGINPGIANRSDPTTGIALGNGSQEFQVGVLSDPDDPGSAKVPKTALILSRTEAKLAADYYPNKNEPKGIVTVDYIDGHRFPAYSDDKTIGVFAGDDEDAPNNSVANQFVITSYTPDADSASTVINVFAIDEENAVFIPPIRVNTIQGRQADDDASISLGSTVTIDSQQSTPLNLTSDKDGLLIRTTNKNGRQYWHGQDPDGWAVCTRQVINGSVQSVRSFGAVGDYEKPDWRVYSGGFQADAYIKSTKVAGINATDAVLLLSEDAKLSAENTYYQILASGTHIFQCNNSQSRFTSDGRLLVNKQTPDDGYLSTFLQSKTDETGVLRYVTSNDKGTSSLYVDCNPVDNTSRFSSQGQICVTETDGSEYRPQNEKSIATKKYCDDKIVVCTGAEYAAISPKLSGTLYCLTD